MSRIGMMAACGLDCRTCSIRRAPFDPAAADEALSWYRSKGWLAEEDGVAEAVERGLICHGCHGDRSAHWSADCWILRCCVDEHRLRHCAECATFPCDRLAQWAATDESYAQALERLRALRVSGT